VLDVKKIRLILELRESGISDSKILSAIEKIPREKFIPENFRNQAYDNLALPIGDNQKIYFSSIKYSKMLYDKESSKLLSEFKNIKFTLVTGIADSSHLINYLNDSGYNFNHILFKDHHDFSNSDIIKIDRNNLIITTEKDYVKLFTKITSSLYYLPIEFIIDNEVDFSKQILDYIQTRNS